MSALIRGMDAPTNCWQCPFHDDVDDCILLNQSCMKVWGENKCLDDCPLVPVQSHGRLIDADALNLDYEVEMADDWKTAHEIANVVKYAPTIIDAEE